MKHRVAIKTLPKLRDTKGVEFIYKEEAYCRDMDFYAKAENSYDVFTEEFDNDLPEDRIVDISEDGDSYVCEIDGAFYRVDDWMINDNLNV